MYEPLLNMNQINLEKFWSFDIGNGALFEIAQHRNKDKLTPCHIAFRAKNKDQV
jgi:tRNA-binding EMAP/Myf-like protein